MDIEVKLVMQIASFDKLVISTVNKIIVLIS